MSLPIDISGSTWFMPVAVWEWEPDPNQPADASSTAAAHSAAGGTQVSDTGTPPGRLVFKGYANASSFHWFAAASPLSRPWERSRDDDTDQRERAEPKITGDAIAPDAKDLDGAR